MCELDRDESDEPQADHARRGCRDCFGHLYSRYRGALSRYVFEAFLGTMDDALEVEDETWRKAFEHLPSYRASRPFRAWLFAIARNHAFNQLRRRRSEPLQDFAIPSPVEPRNPLDELERHEGLSRCSRLVAALPADLREPFYLRTVEGFRIRTIAGILSVPVTTVKGRLLRARKALVDSVRNDRRLQCGETP